jgi:dihydrofolate reductase
LFPYWSQVTEPDDLIARALNTLPKHIVSRTLRSPEWQHSSVISGDVVEAIKTLKSKPGRELHEHNLVDEYRLLVFPLVLGSGKRLFGDRTCRSRSRQSPARPPARARSR